MYKWLVIYVVFLILQEEIRKLLEKKHEENIDLNTSIQNRKDFRNPRLVFPFYGNCTIITIAQNLIVCGFIPLIRSKMWPFLNPIAHYPVKHELGMRCLNLECMNVLYFYEVEISGLVQDALYETHPSALKPGYIHPVLK